MDIPCYKPGALKFVTPEQRRRYDEADAAEDYVLMEELHDLLGVAWLPPDTLAWLPHQCDSWCIGGVEQIRALIADLQAALAKIEEEGDDFPQTPELVVLARKQPALALIAGPQLRMYREDLLRARLWRIADENAALVEPPAEEPPA